MKRQIKGYALLLRSERFCEMHKKLTLFLPDIGIITAFAHGALKPGNRFSGRTELFALSQVDLYFSPAKETYSLREMEVVDFFSGMRENPGRYVIASCWCELLIKTEALNESKRVFNLMVQALRFLDVSDDVSRIWLHIQFLLRILAFGGLFPNLYECSGCGRSFGAEESFFLDAGEGGAYCSRCVNRSLFLLTPEDSRYIMETMRLNLADSLCCRNEIKRSKQLLGCVMELIRQQLGVHLQSFDMALGVFK